MISHIGPSSYAWVKCNKGGFKSSSGRVQTLHIHVCDCPQKHITHTHLHCSFFLLTYTPRSVIRAYTYTGTCITSQAPYVQHHTVKAYTCVGGKIYNLFAIHNRYAILQQRNTLFLINAPFVKGTIITSDSNLTNHRITLSTHRYRERGWNHTTTLKVSHLGSAKY